MAGAKAGRGGYDLDVWPEPLNLRPKWVGSNTSMGTVQPSRLTEEQIIGNLREQQARVKSAGVGSAISCELPCGHARASRRLFAANSGSWRSSTTSPREISDLGR
jgi:hypothetical protein